ncbi:ABC transporter substrate-binding protein [Faecalicatena sp. AGMB00832]|uniref:ABC transporter substrate-binding protein n=1 Tax=Faecalicatena faecalis TaxID=2726362 RepID=A0ABS6D804_9FIRM|nr:MULTISPECIES: ABC transporter substrate-binding protein [Faecalicatena]MBU3877598.1 ABC transporter substrate-binding protein [Faecalicatena faecalis]MCI6463905.1 ABC transporter substrate-binding protein [Faecalicatena sp.]MDY5620805.1 ABC transporter substrate-binding protein [Lachnospiraceae bacterium]
MKKRSLAFMVSIAMAATLMGCGGDDSASGGSAEEPKEVTLTIGSNADQPTSLDRFVNVGYGCDDLDYLIFDPLVNSDHQGTYTPGLATEWEVSEDYLTYTFTLRDGVKFTDGSEFTSADVAATFNRIMTDETLTDTGAWGNLESVETPDDQTAVMHLSAVMPTFYDELYRVPILCAAALETDPEGYFITPTGTGAFTVDSFDQLSGNTVLRRNDDWWGWKEMDQEKTNVEVINYQFIGEDTTRASALKAGDMDIVLQLSMDYKEDLESSGYKMIEVPSDTHIHVEYNCAKDALFNNKDLRIALSEAINREEIVNSILGGGEVATWPCPSSNLGYVDNGEGYKYDLEEAKKLVDASGYDGSEIDLIYTSSSFIRADEVAQAIQSMAEEIGLNIKLEPLEQATFTDRRSTGKFDLILGAFASTAGDTQTEVAVIIGFDVFGSNYMNADLTALCDQIRVCSDKEERTKLLEQVFQLEMDEMAPFSYLYSPVYVCANADNVENYHIFADGSGEYRFVQKN